MAQVESFDFTERVEAVRRFNRFYTRQIGLLQEHLLESLFSLTEARVLYELAHREGVTATEIGRELGLDASYLSRILRGFEKRGLMAKQPSERDGRQSLLRLTETGREAFSRLDTGARDEISVLLNGLPSPERNRLVAAMQTIQNVLVPVPDVKTPYLLRLHQPGDMGWMVQRHGALYADEYGWDETFEGLVAGIVADFLRQHDPKRERCWIAERDGENVGSVMLVRDTDPVRESETVAKLRLLLVEPKARGLGIGGRLVSECLRFARQAGYRKVTLWTNSVLHAARHIYEKAGFRLVAEEPHHSFGHDLTGQTWEKELDAR